MQAVHRVLPPAHDPFESLIPPGGIKLTPRHYAYIKIAEGCNHRCTFCIIPSLRGRLVSRPIADVLREAEALVSAGVKELLVVSQDTRAYGVDLRPRTELAGPPQPPAGARRIERAPSPPPTDRAGLPRGWAWGVEGRATATGAAVQPRPSKA